MWNKGPEMLNGVAYEENNVSDRFDVFEWVKKSEDGGCDGEHTSCLFPWKRKKLIVNCVMRV